MLPKCFSKPLRWPKPGSLPAGLTTVNIDFVRHYRPQANVVARPTRGIGTGFSLVGHHELLIPLLAAALVEAD